MSVQNAKQINLKQCKVTPITGTNHSVVMAGCWKSVVRNDLLGLQDLYFIRFGSRLPLQVVSRITVPAECFYCGRWVAPLKAFGVWSYGVIMQLSRDEVETINAIPNILQCYQSPVDIKYSFVQDWDCLCKTRLSDIFNFDVETLQYVTVTKKKKWGLFTRYDVEVVSSNGILYGKYCVSQQTLNAVKEYMKNENIERVVLAMDHQYASITSMYVYRGQLANCLSWNSLGKWHLDYNVPFTHMAVDTNTIFNIDKIDEPLYNFFLVQGIYGESSSEYCAMSPELIKTLIWSRVKREIQDHD